MTNETDFTETAAMAEAGLTEASSVENAMAGFSPDQTYELAQACVAVCQETKAEDIILFDVQGKTILADYFIVCSGNSRPHIRALADHLKTAMLEHGLRPRGLDGVPGNNQWVVLDYGAIIIHILDHEARRFYRLEELWDDRKIVFRSSADTPPAAQ